VKFEQSQENSNNNTISNLEEFFIEPSHNMHHILRLWKKF